MAEYFVYNGGLYSTDELKHYGVKGMKWGVHKSVYKSTNKKQLKNRLESFAVTQDLKLRKLRQKKELAKKRRNIYEWGLERR